MNFTVQDNPVLCVGILTCFFLVLVVRYLRSPWRKLPPGPPGYPVLGNALQLKDKQWLLFSSWRKTYGDIIYLNAAGQPAVIINKPSIASELLDRRAGIYSDRPPNIVGCEIMTGGLLFAFASYSDTWRRMRKGAHESVNKVVVHDLDEYQLSEALGLARSGVQDPTAWDGYLRRAAASLMLSSLYGERPLESERDPRVVYINALNEQLSNSFAPGAYWVEMMPWMRHIPSRFAAWRRTAEEWNRTASNEFLRLFGRVRDNILNGQGKTSFCSTLLDEADRYGLNDQEKAWLAATLYAAGADTTATAMSWWTLAMLAYPDVQVRAQQELDAVVGRSRVPTFADMPHLPYICAIVKEILRWRPAVPLGLAHRSSADDVYDGYFIPKGTMIIANVWELNRDPETYGPDSYQFNPARYLDEKGRLISGPPGTKEDGHFAFGFGRRVCLGKHVATNSMFAQIATCLWASTLSNVQNQTIDVNAFLDEGIIARPMPFQVDIQPRFPEATVLLAQECELRGR
ncbi:unnamed protein product [Peniophora sp. CBMAI 1063]|nr:unnamed protein product [Peniophora sp. CBMAI 1063]